MIGKTISKLMPPWTNVQRGIRQVNVSLIRSHPINWMMLNYSQLVLTKKERIKHILGKIIDIFILQGNYSIYEI